MPSRSAVLAAGRFDLHHGIMYQGGYKAAARTLDRPHSWPRHKVKMRFHQGDSYLVSWGLMGLGLRNGPELCCFMVRKGGCGYA